jgi:ribosome-associated protein YbcJ (S4-like RNA binding protein)
MQQPRTNTLRLDELLVQRGLFASRSRARDAVLRGAVRVDGTVEAKPGRSVAVTAVLNVDDPAQAYVARSALKLIAALDHFSLDPNGLTALDIGASTGGFTQVLLERSAAHVIALDVGHGQLHDSLRNDPRVTVIEGLNARELTAAHLGGSRRQFPRRRCQFHLAALGFAAGSCACRAGRKGGLSGQAAIRGGARCGRQGWHRSRSSRRRTRCTGIV